MKGSDKRKTEGNKSDEVSQADEGYLKGRWIIILLFLCCFVGFGCQFFNPLEKYRNKISILTSTIGVLCLLSYFAYTYYKVSEENKSKRIEKSKKEEEGSWDLSSMDNIETDVGLGSGYYLCLISLSYAGWFAYRRRSRNEETIEDEYTQLENEAEE